MQNGSRGHESAAERDELTSLEAAGWAAAVATFLAVVVALLKEDIQALAPPDCHKTEFAVFNPQTGAVIDRWPCYYFRIWIENVGNVRGNARHFSAGLRDDVVQWAVKPIRSGRALRGVVW